MTLSQSLTAIAVAFITVFTPLFLNKNRSESADEKLSKLKITLDIAKDCLTLLEIEKEHVELHRIHNPTAEGSKLKVRNDVHLVYGRKPSKRCTPSRLETVIQSLEKQIKELEK